MGSILKEILRCLLNVFYKIHINCNCSKCCQSDCMLETENIDNNNEQSNKPPNENNKTNISLV